MIKDIQPEKIRKYPLEIGLIVLAACVMYLFVQYNSLNNYIRGEFFKTQNENSNALRENSQVLREINIFLNKKQSNSYEKDF